MEGCDTCFNSNHEALPGIAGLPLKGLRLAVEVDASLQPPVACPSLRLPTADAGCTKKNHRSESGTLDGGHVAYGLFGEKARKIFPFMIGLLITLSFLPALLSFSMAAFNYSWLLWGMILFWLGNVRVQPLDDITPLDPKRRALGIFILIVFVLLFTPIPMMAY